MPRKTRRARKRAFPKSKEDPAALFIPAGLFLGMGLGFLYSNITAGIFLGLGVGFVFFAMAKLGYVKVAKKRR